MTDSEAQLRLLIRKETGREVSGYSVDDDLFIEMGLDSLEALALLAKLEKHFDFRIPNEEISDTRSIRAILGQIRKAGKLP